MKRISSSNMNRIRRKLLPVNNVAIFLIISKLKALERIYSISLFMFITFRASRRRRKMHSGHARLSVCVCVSVCVSVCLSVCQLCLLQSVHELRCYGNITRMRNVSKYMLVYTCSMPSFLVLVSHLAFSATSFNKLIYYLY